MAAKRPFTRRGVRAAANGRNWRTARRRPQAPSAARRSFGGPMSDAFAMDRMMENLEDRRLFSITTTTEVVKVPGPTDVVLVVGTNPAGHTPPGQGDVI